MSEHHLSRLCLSSPYGAPLFQEKHDSARAQLEVNIRKTPDRGDALIFLLHVREGNHKIRRTGLVCHCVVPSVAAAVAVAAATQRADGAAHGGWYWYFITKITNCP